jgi:hypothetical protein
MCLRSTACTDHVRDPQFQKHVAGIRLLYPSLPRVKYFLPSFDRLSFSVLLLCSLRLTHVEVFVTASYCEPHQSVSVHCGGRVHLLRAVESTI